MLKAECFSFTLWGIQNFLTEISSDHRALDVGNFVIASWAIRLSQRAGGEGQNEPEATT